MEYNPQLCADRFWAKIVKTDYCWNWNTSALAKGYGLFSTGKHNGNKLVTAHRFSWTLHHGQIPTGLHVLHRCDNPLCVRAICAVPNCQHRRYSDECESHLYLGNHCDNMMDIGPRKRSRTGRESSPISLIYPRPSRPYRKSGRPRKQQDPANRRPSRRRRFKLRDEHIRDMLRLRSAGMPNVTIAGMFETSPAYVNHLIMARGGRTNTAVGMRHQPLDATLESQLAVRYHFILLWAALDIVTAESHRILDRRLL